MRKIISLLITIMLVLVSGCSYILPAEDKNASDKGITYINLSELISNAKNNQTVKEVVEDVSDNDETAEEDAVEETTVTEIPTIKVTEGDLVAFPNLKANDPDGDKVTYTFSAPLDAKGEWQTKAGDAGEKTITITASDGRTKVKQDVKILIEALNKAPVLQNIDDIMIDEGKTLKLEPKATDPEGKPVTITYSGFMTSDTKALDYTSSGEYIVRVTASDGEKQVYQDVKITVKDVNRAPEFINII